MDLELFYFRNGLAKVWVGHGGKLFSSFLFIFYFLHYPHI